MSPLKISATALLAAAAPALACAADLIGAWTVKAEVAGQPRSTLVCVFKGAGDAVAGPCIAATGRNLPTAGRIAPGKMSFGYLTDYNGSGVHLDFSGSTNSLNQVTGTVVAGSSKGVFGGVEVAETPARASTTWKFSVAFSDELKYVVLCTFKTDGARINGPCNIVEGADLATTASSSGADVKLAYDADVKGAPTRFEYTGALAADGAAIKGSVKTADAAGTFTAARR